jgi:hypothetical protein
VPRSNRHPAGESLKTSKTIWNTVLLAGLFLLLSACGKGEAQFSALDIERAEWRGEKVLVSGEWMKGLSTPPTCRVFEGRDGPMSDYFGLDARVSLDGHTFSKEFVPVEADRKDPPAKKEDYYVRCTVSLDSGRTAEDTVKVDDAS